MEVKSGRTRADLLSPGASLGEVPKITQKRMTKANSQEQCPEAAPTPVILAERTKKLVSSSVAVFRSILTLLRPVQTQKVL